MENKKFLKSMEERGFNILSGKTRISIGMGNSHIYDKSKGYDYAFVNEKVQDRISEFRIEEKVNSDY